MPARGRPTRNPYGWPHQRAVAQLWSQHHDGDTCARCGRPTYRDPGRNYDGRKLQGDHVGTPLAVGDGLPDALTHARCNLAHGARLGNRLRGRRRKQAQDLPAW